MMSGNRGEWSEVYAFLRLLADGKLFAADEQLRRINGMFFPIMKIIREETVGTAYEYRPNHTNAKIEIYLNDKQISHVPASDFKKAAACLFYAINNSSASRGAFVVPKTNAFISNIYIKKLKAPSSNKADISIQIHDVNTGYEKVVGFSIKSELGMPPTLLNAGKTTNFIYKIQGLNQGLVDQINKIATRSKIKDRIKAITDNGGQFVFKSMENNIFNNNLTMIDSQMPIIVAQMLIGYYSEVATNCTDLTNYVSNVNPVSLSECFYTHKIKDMLCAIALGMNPATKWNGTDEATGGYIIVRTNGDVLAYHIYNRDSFRGYLLNNTKLESASSKRHGYGVLYVQDKELYIKLNLQIRFMQVYIGET